MTTVYLPNDKKNFFEDISKNVIGIDEVGRGALCGPVVSCSVLLDKSILEHPLVQEINDSKKISEKKRDLLSDFIKKFSTYSFGIAENQEIDKINILKATILSMQRSFEKFKDYDNIVKIDGQKTFELNKNTVFIIKGDQKSVSIAAASILAKNHRDSFMKEMSKTFPEYEWGKNKGYGTMNHMNAIKKFGVTPLHRESFLKKLNFRHRQPYRDL